MVGAQAFLNCCCRKAALQRIVQPAFNHLSLLTLPHSQIIPQGGPPVVAQSGDGGR